MDVEIPSLSAKGAPEKRFQLQAARIEELTASLDDLRSQVSRLNTRVSELRDSLTDQIASVRGRQLASERWKNKQENLEPASLQDIFASLSLEDRRMLRAMLGTTSPPPTSGQSQTENR